MPLLTVVEDYVIAAMKHAVPEELEDGTIGATIPGCPGIVAFGADSHECAAALYARLEDWVRVSILTGHALPVIDGIDLNTESARIRPTYRDAEAPAGRSAFYADEDELEVAFERRSKPA